MSIVSRMGFLVVALIFAAQTHGSIEWKKHVIFEGSARAIHTAVATDLDGDGFVDVVASFDTKTVAFKGPGWKAHVVDENQLGRSRSKPRPACIHSCLMDPDGDGDMDFVGSNLTVFWLETPDDPFNGEMWRYRTVDDVIAGSHCLITHDVNQDGKMDLIANSFKGEKDTIAPFSITWLEVPSDPKSSKNWIRHVFADKDAPGGNHYMGFGDLNGDGRPDISCGAKGGKGFPNGEWFAWWEQGEDPTKPWKKHMLSDTEPGATNIIPADLDGDGRMDLFATRGHGKGALWFKGPEFERIMIDPEMDGPHTLVVEDLDGDGDLDAATVSRHQDGWSVWYENDGMGNFVRRIFDRDQASYDLRAVDMDGDGDLDLLCAGHNSNNVVWYENGLK